jgi:hypothetical protein
MEDPATLATTHSADDASSSLFGWLVGDGWCWFVLREEYCWLVAGGWFFLREKYCWLVAGGWFFLREKYCWLVADKPSDQAAGPASMAPPCPRQEATPRRL